MTEIKNRSFWFWGFIILIIINLSALTTMFFIGRQMHQQPSFGFNQGRLFNRGSLARSHGGRVNYIWNEMNLSPQQEAFFNEQRDLHFEHMTTLKGVLAKKHAQLFDEISKSKADSLLINQLKQETLAAHLAIIDETQKHYEALKKVLNEDQMQLLNTRISNHFFPNSPHARHRNNRFNP